MSICNDFLTELIIQDIIKANSTKATKFFLNILCYTKSMANFYAMGFSFFLTYHYFKEYQD